MGLLLPLIEVLQQLFRGEIRICAKEGRNILHANALSALWRTSRAPENLLSFSSGSRLSNAPPRLSCVSPLVAIVPRWGLFFRLDDFFDAVFAPTIL